MAKVEYKTDKENYKELLTVARSMTERNIETALRQRNAFHKWAVKAYEQALWEKQHKSEKVSQ